ncbi:MAG: chemotaxis protein CheA [Marinilabiliaceae bacterium]|nr:chemotaxis protein CheA [Marinilabiliaceae bacterium]
MDDLEKFRELFIKEATTLIDSLEEILLDLEKDSNNLKRVEEVFRVMHTLKGVGGMYGYTGVGDLTHGLESIYDQVRNGNISVNNEILDLTFASIDHLYSLLEDQEVRKPENIARQNEFQLRISKLVNTIKKGSDIKRKLPEIKKSDKSTYNIIFQPEEKIIESRINVLYSFKDLAELGEIKAIKSLTSDDNKERWSLFFVGNCTVDEVEEAMMFIWEFCTIEKVADFDLFDENELNARQEFIKSVEVDLVADSSSDDEVTETDNSISKTVTKSTTVLDSIRQNMNRVSVDSEKLDYLMYLVSELITNNSQLALLTVNQSFDSIRPQIEKLDKLSKLFRNNVLDIRLIPMRDIVPKFQRMIRDISKQLGKEVEFITEGMDTELDKSSIDVIVEPMVHLIRNAMDHGIESPEERAEKGKTPKGVIRLSAYYSGNNVYVKIEDDGKGIDEDVIRKKAISIGLINKEDKLSEKEILNLICHAGFSTAQQVTSLSGRGVGMDVVKQKIAEIRGEFEISSKKDKGTTIIMKLQQSVAILDTLLVKSESMKWLIPLADVEVCSQITDSELDKFERTGTLEFEKELIPFISLRSYFHNNKNKVESLKVVVLRKNNQRYAIVTDEIVGQHQAVLKDLGRLMKNHKEISAASLLGNGEVAFLLNTNVFYESMAKTGVN